MPRSGTTKGRAPMCLDCTLCYGVTNIEYVPQGADCRTWCDPRTVTQQAITVTGGVGFTCDPSCGSDTPSNVHDTCASNHFCTGRDGQVGICTDCVACEANLPSCGVDCALHCGMSTVTATTVTTIFVPDEPGEVGEYCDPTAPFDVACLECVDGLV